jgi:hypothetical protein
MLQDWQQQEDVAALLNCTFNSSTFQDFKSCRSSVGNQPRVLKINSAGGKGVFPYNSYQDFMKHQIEQIHHGSAESFCDSVSGDGRASSSSSSGTGKDQQQSSVEVDTVIQKYITNPFLIYGQYKFDIRYYVLIASTSPWLIFVKPGIVRKSAAPYNSSADLSSNQSSVRAGHLTNLAQQIIFQRDRTTSAAVPGAAQNQSHGIGSDNTDDLCDLGWSMSQLQTYLDQEHPGRFVLLSTTIAHLS